MVNVRPYHIFVIVQLSMFADGLIFSDVHWTTAIRLSEYVGYRSVSLLSYNIPAQSTKVTFTFQAKTSGKSCRFREVHVYFQHGSYPLVTPYNETFPPHFYTNRTGAFHVKIQKDAEAVSYILPTPNPGLWYFAAFLPKPSTDKIQQKGLDKSCLYGMVVIVEAQGLDNIVEIPIQKSQHVHLNQEANNNQALYKFNLPKDTVEYNVKVNNCVVKQSNRERQKNKETSTNQPTVDHSVPGTSNISGLSLQNVSSSSSENSGNDSSENVTEVTKMSTPLPSSVTNNISSSTPAPITGTAQPDPVLSTCPVIARIQSNMLPSVDSVTMDKCGDTTSCKKTIQSPVVDDWTYIIIEIDDSYNVSDIEFDLSFHVKECESFKFLLPKTILHRLQRDPSEVHIGPKQDSCIKTNSLGRFDWSERTFNVTYVFSNQGPIPIPEPLNNIPVEDTIVIVTSFSVQEPTDIGGTFSFHSSLNLSKFDTKTQTVIVYMCLMRGVLPGGQTVRKCKAGILVTLDVNQTSNHVYVPYPEPGTWYLGLNSHCFDKSTQLEARCTSIADVDLQLGISGCVSGQCGEYGECTDYISGVHVFSSCKCYAGWQGYGCTDGRDSRSRSEELTAVLLLTLSNLFFIPSSILAVYRRYFVEAAIYTFTMFLSAFYHACDTSELVYFCLLRYDILSFADFLGSISSFWVTMLVMAKLPRSVRGFAQTVGAIGIAVGVEYDRHGLLVFAIPAGLAALVMFGSWIFQCRQKRQLYPTKRYLLIHLLPGIILASVGLVLFAFLETDDNYKYTHSCWHVAMSLSIVFLLPPRQQKGIIDINSNDTISPGGSTNTDTNMSTRIVLNSYTGTSNGHVVCDGGLVTGDNPAFISPD